MSKIRLNKKKLLGLLTVGSLVLATIPVSKNLNSKENIKERQVHENINPLFNFNIDDDDYIILDVGDHNDVKTHFQARKMTYCNKNDLPLGIIISTNSKTEVDIYNDVEYTKGLLRDYQITLPVYLNIDEVITATDLNIEMKSKLIKNFLEKCSSNNIYVGIYGTDTNLCRVRKYCDIPSSDAFLVMDSSTIKYEGTYNIYKDLTGKIIKQNNLHKAIIDKELNQAKNFVFDASYQVTAPDLIDISLKYGLSIDELLEFNNLSKKDITEKISIRIPSAIAPKIPLENIDYERISHPLRGCDLSYAQGTDINWEKLKENFDFVILKCSQGVEVDTCFEENAKNCNLNDIPIGVYCYNNYTSLNTANSAAFLESQERQAAFVISNLKNKNIEYPVYFDIESSQEQNLSTELSKENVNVMLDVWYDKMTSSGYIPGIYCNQDGYKYLNSCLDYNLSDKLEVWVAGGDQYSAGKEDIDLKDVEPSSILLDNEEITMAQSTDSAINSGAGNHNGHLDINYSLIDYTKERATLNNQGTTEFKIKEFSRYDKDLILGGTLTLLTSGIIAASIKKYKKKVKLRKFKS